MKFFTKKTKIVFLVIILIGAILLAYNSLSYHLDYQTLKGNSSSLGTSLITEGFQDNSGNSYYNEIRNNMQKSFEAIAASNNSNSGNMNPNDNNNDNDNGGDMNGKYTSYASNGNMSSNMSNSNMTNPSNMSNSTPYSNSNMTNPSNMNNSTPYNNNNNTSSGNTYSNTSSPTSISASQIPAGDEDQYILKSEIVPPVCPVCPSVTPCPNKPTPPCPPCGRCPESPFECKKVPNYSNNSSGFLPNPVLTDFSTFGM